MLKRVIVKVESPIDQAAVFQSQSIYTAPSYGQSLSPNQHSPMVSTRAILQCQGMVGTLGIEPRTDRLKAECSTAELGALTSNPQ
jgi:hypothetical protein